MFEESVHRIQSRSGASRILIVEDELIVALDLQNTLQDLGYAQVAIADSAEDAVLQAEIDRPDLVLMDVQLRGERDGIWAADQIRGKLGAPVIFVTANTNNETLARAKAAGPYGFLNKPFRPKELDAAISIALHQHQLTRELFAERSWFSTTMCSLSDGVIATDANALVRFLNPVAEQLTGWAKSEAIGKPIEEIYPLSTLGGDRIAECQLRKAIRRRDSVPKERFLLTHAGGKRIPVEDAAAPIVEQGQVLGAVTTFMDISNRLRQEQEVQRAQRQLQERVELTWQALGQTREELEALSRHLLVAQEEERGRIARELHDDLGQQVALLGLRMADLRGVIPAEAQPQLESIRQGLVTLASGLRQVSHQLHPSVLEDLGLEEAIHSLVHEYATAGITIQANTGNLPDISMDIATSLYRIAQEALQNVQKHAEGAVVRLTLFEKEQQITLCIEDSGPGFSLEKVRHRGGLGLIGMQERARLVGGSLSVNADPGDGTTVVASVPLRPPVLDPARNRN